MKLLFEIQKVMLDSFDSGRFYYREIFEKITLDNAITGVLGARGIGKTTYLLHMVKERCQESSEKALYVSADNPFFLRRSLLELADYLYKETDAELLCIDEIHKYPNWQQEIKNIADIYKKIKVLFTGSSMIDIIHSKYDLSRRVTLHYFGGLSFREYLEFNSDFHHESITIDDLLKHHLALASDINISKLLKHFREYLSSGYYLFCGDFTLEVDKFQAIENITQKIIYEDIASLHNLKTSSLQGIENTYKFILTSSPGELNANKLANLLSKSYDQVIEYLSWLEQAGLINCICVNKGGKALVRSPKKLLPENTNLMYAAYTSQIQSDLIAKLRETFFINQLRNVNERIFYSKVGDFCLDGTIFEIGGKNKATSQIQGEKNAFVVADDILIGDKKTIPLYLFGFLY